MITGQTAATAVGADHVLIYDASATALKKALVSDFGNTDEEIQDLIGAMFSSNTETGISVTYQDGDGTLDLVIGDDVIVQSMIADNAIDSQHYVDGSIDTAHYADNSITGDELADNIVIAGTLGAAGGTTNGIAISQGAIKIKNGGSKSYIDLYCESSNAHYTRIEAAAHSAYSGNVTVTLPVATGTLALTSGNITGSAATLTTARTIGGTSFDGSANIAVGLAATATALATSRTIHGVGFDGTANIDLSEVISDTVGAMFSSNTETGIAATYQDGDNTIDLVIGDDVIVQSMIADNAIDSQHYVDGSIDTAHIADDQITTDKLANAINDDIASKATTGKAIAMALVFG
jgi:hypothetical protein